MARAQVVVSCIVSALILLHRAAHGMKALGCTGPLLGILGYMLIICDWIQKVQFCVCVFFMNIVMYDIVSLLYHIITLLCFERPSSLDPDCWLRDLVWGQSSLCLHLRRAPVEFDHRMRETHAWLNSG